MDIIAITPIQQLLGILLVFLLAWMMTFAWLAIKQTPESNVEKEERAYYRSLSAQATAATHTHTMATVVTVGPSLSIETAKRVPVTLATHEVSTERYLERSVR